MTMPSATGVWPWSAMRRLAAAPTSTLAQRAALLAAVTWADREGRLRPSIETWARVAGLSTRGLQRALRELEALGLVERERESRGGPRGTNLFRIPLLAKNPDPPSGLEPRPASPSTPTGATRNPDRRDAQPRPPVGGTPINGKHDCHEPGARRLRWVRPDSREERRA